MNCKADPQVPRTGTYGLQE